MIEPRGKTDAQGWFLGRIEHRAVVLNYEIVALIPLLASSK